MLQPRTGGDACARPPHAPRAPPPRRTLRTSSPRSRNAAVSASSRPGRLAPRTRTTVASASAAWSTSMVAADGRETACVAARRATTAGRRPAAGRVARGVRAAARVGMVARRGVGRNARGAASNGSPLPPPHPPAPSFDGGGRAPPLRPAARRRRRAPAARLRLGRRSARARGVVGVNPAESAGFGELVGVEEAAGVAGATVPMARAARIGAPAHAPPLPPTCRYL